MQNPAVLGEDVCICATVGIFNQNTHTHSNKPEFTVRKTIPVTRSAALQFQSLSHPVLSYVRGFVALWLIAVVSSKAVNGTTSVTSAKI